MNIKDKKFKFSVRKYKTGTASILLGTCLAIGAANSNEAKAAEETNQETKLATQLVVNTENQKLETTTQTNTGEASIPNTKNNENENNIIEKRATENTTQKQETVSVDNKEPAITDTTGVKDDKKENISITPKSIQVSEKTQIQESKSNKESDYNPSRFQTNIDATAPMVESPEENLKESLKEESKQGQDVTSKVKVTEGKIEGNETVNPHQGERTTLKYHWTFDKDIKPNDYFDFTISKNVNTYGVSVIKKVPDIKNGSVVMATGQVMDNGKIRYTFSDYILNKVNVTANLTLNLFFDPKVVQKAGEQTISATLNNKTISKTVDVKYLNGVSHSGISVNGAIETLDKQNRKFTHIAYINPLNNKISTASIYGNITNGFSSTSENIKIKIYEYIGSEELPQSVTANITDSSRFKDVTNQLSNNLILKNNGYQLDLNNLDKRYIIIFEGNYDNDAKDLNFRTTVSGYSPYYNRIMLLQLGITA